MDKEKQICDECGKELDASKSDSFEYSICSECIKDLPNETGYCSISCRLGCGCDGSC